MQSNLSRTFPYFTRYSYVLLLWRIGLAYAMYSLARVLFYVYNHDLLQIANASELTRAFAGGLRFDTVAILYVNLLVIVLHIIPIRKRMSVGYQRVLMSIYFVCNIPALIVNMGDVVYYRFTLRRTATNVFSDFANDNPLGFVRFVWEYWPITLTTLAIIALWIYLYKVVRPYPEESIPQRGALAYYSLSALGCAASAILVVMGIRGQKFTDHRPINTTAAMCYVDKPQQMALVLNTPFTLLRNIGKARLSPMTYYSSDDEARIYYDPIYLPKSSGEHYGLMAGRNVVFIIWESLSREWIGHLNRDIEGYEGFTPFVDSLLPHAYYWEHAYAAGSISMDAMPAIFASIPKPKVPFVSSAYSGNEINSLVYEIGKQGYATAFFHNAPTGSMQFDAFTRQAGFKRYYGMEDYGNDADFDGSWGIWDKEFLQYMIRQIDTLPQPFLVAEFTTSSHNPYRVPESFAQRYPEGSHKLHRPIRYTDEALRDFFAEARKRTWFENTLFVIVADHAVPGELSSYKTSEGLFRIPIILYDPQGTLVGQDTEHVVQQNDIFPTLLNLLGIDSKVVCFGKDMFDNEVEHFAVNGIDGAYQMICGPYVMHFDGEEVTALYDRYADKMLTCDIKAQHPEVLTHLTPMLKAYLQGFNNRMINNTLNRLPVAPKP